jgi:hypothetical protein
MLSITPVKRPVALFGAAFVVSALALSPPAEAQRAPNTPAGYYQEEFLDAVRRNLPPLQACYDAARAEGDAAWQRLRTATVVINSDGTIGPVTLNPGPGAPGIEPCMRAVFQRWRLTPPMGGTAITLTYTRVQLERAIQPPRPARTRRR